MNWEQAESKWYQWKGLAKAKWARLTDSDLEFIAGKRDQLVGKIQERYGVAKDEAEKQVNEWRAGFDAQLAEHRSARKAG
ncbi:MAG TPA: CsbD family protein [Candidatus Angelobacter sp.]